MVVAFGSRPAVQRIAPGPGDGVFDAGEVIVEDFLGSRAGDDRGFAIGRRHGNLCGHESASQIGSEFGAGHESVSYRVPIWSLLADSSIVQRLIWLTQWFPRHILMLYPPHTPVALPIAS